MYLPVWNSCEWLAILNGIMQKRYHKNYQEVEQALAPESTQVYLNEMNQPSSIHSAADEEYRRLRSRVFHTDLGCSTGVSR